MFWVHHQPQDLLRLPQILFNIKYKICGGDGREEIPESENPELIFFLSLLVVDQNLGSLTHVLLTS